MKIVGLFALSITILYLFSCSTHSALRSRAFDSIKLGDSREAVVDVLGRPDAREFPEELFARYASTPCDGACKERLWFENKLSMGIEAWSVELDEGGNVIDKTHWHSP